MKNSKSTKKPRLKVGDIIQREAGWIREVTEVYDCYFGEKGRFGVYYRDKTSPVNICSEKHMLRWGKKIN